MKRIVLAVVLLLFGVSNAGAVTCTISGTLNDPSGNPIPNGVIQFNSLIDQTVAGVVIPATLASSTSDATGHISGFAIQQGISGQFVICNPKAGGCGTPTPTLIPVATTANLADVLSGTAISAGNGTVGNLTVTGTTTMSYTGCTAINLAQATIGSTPPDGDFGIVSGGHCVSGGGFIADSNSAVMFANYTRNTTTGYHNAGWQWLGNTGLTPGANFTPTVIMALSPDAANSVGYLSTGVLSIGEVILGGSVIKSSGSADFGASAGAHWVTGTGWVADQSNASFMSLSGASFSFFGNSGLTVGSVIPTLGNGFTISPGTQSFVWNQNGNTETLTANTSTGTGAQAGFFVENANGIVGGFSALGTGWSSGAPYLANEAYLNANTAQGLLVYSAGPLHLAASSQGANGTLDMTEDGGGNFYFANSNTAAGTRFTGGNPTLVVYSTTNGTGDILEVYPQNATIGLGFWYNGIRAIGSNGNNYLQLDGQGGGAVYLNINNHGPAVLGGHLLSEGAAPSIASGCGGSASFLGGSTDFSGGINVGSGASSSCTVNFGAAFGASPFCQCTVHGITPGALEPCSANASTTQLTLVYGSVAGTYITWICPGYN